MLTISPDIIKEAGVLRNRLAKGLINTSELDQFLAKVESVSPPKPRKNTGAHERFLFQLENLERGRARKPLIIK